MRTAFTMEPDTYGAGTPYVSSGGFSVPSIGSTFSSPGAPASGTVQDDTPLSVPSGSGAAGATLLPVLPVLMPGASGTPTYSAPATGGGTSSDGAVVPSTSPDYFEQVLDLIGEQLHTGQPSATQQFDATPILLPSGGSYNGGGGGIALGGDGTSASPRSRIGGFVVLAIVAGVAFYWFYWRKRHGAA